MESIEIQSKNLSSITAGKLEAKWSANGARILRYYIDFWHNDLDLHKELSAPELYLLQGKVDALMAAWDKKLLDHRKRRSVAAGKDTADQLTIEAEGRLQAVSGILAHTLKTDDRIVWATLKDQSRYGADPRFRTPKPVQKLPPEPEYSEPEFGILDTLFFRKERIRAEAKNIYEAAYRFWQQDVKRNAIILENEIRAWNINKASFEAQYAIDKQKFLDEQAENNAKIDALAAGVENGEQESVIEHVTLVLEQSEYGDLFEKSFEVDFLAEEKTILIEYELPSPDQMPTLKIVRFVASTGEMRETHISDREQKTNFDAACYQICLRTIHEIFEADVTGNVKKVLFNGSTTYIDRTTGKDVTSCIMSILVDRTDFDAIDLMRVDPKACFKALKGVSGSSLSALAPIAPVMELNKEDRRFIEGRSAVHAVTEATNLAAMDWGDFEHLVRELFEKEFATRGGEVKITQASADGGVDAVAFDPDPITGGKIVIQAKRYTRTVGVSAVRDLYGTMQHESASRGILITTADYGPDAYQFAAGKPITLFTGANLLYLLEKHGYRAKIDLREARKELNLRDYG